MGRKSREKWERKIEQATNLARNNIPDAIGRKESHWAFHLAFWGALLACISFGYTLLDNHVVWASFLFAIAIALVVAGMWLWFGVSWNPWVKTVVSLILVAMFTYKGYGWIIEGFTPLYVYLVPTQGLFDAERRGFVVHHSGPRSLHNVQIVVTDNKSHTNLHVGPYQELGPESNDPLAPEYFWLVPSSPWDEDYSATITSSNSPTIVQRLIVRSTHHILRFATQVNMDAISKPLLACRDDQLPDSYDLAKSSRQPCGQLMAISEATEKMLQPSPFNMALPDGSLTLMKLRTLNPRGEPEGESDVRHLSEWQQHALRSEIAPYPDSRVLILASSGRNTFAYAKDFRDVFDAAKWKVDGPKPVPEIDEGIIDLQTSVHGKLGDTSPPATMAFLNGLEYVHVKHRKHHTLDMDVPDGLLVLWVGAKSPEGVSPDDCMPIAFKPKPHDSAPCSMINQSPKPVPIVPE